MKVFHTPSQRLHHPRYEIFTNTEKVLAYESPARIKSILGSLEKMEWAELQVCQDFGLPPIQAIHSTAYLNFLQTAYLNWKVFSPVKGMAFIPYTYTVDPQTALHGTLPEQDGFFMTDASIAISPSTFTAALDSTNCALSAARAVLQGDRVAVALCRPPGHHAGREICGGYCFLNNSAVAAHWLAQHGKVAILDIDYHAGNGTQAIFYDRDDVLTVSLHADPQRAYPRFAGHAHETGTGPGTGFHRNFPLPAGTDDAYYLLTLGRAINLVAKYDPSWLIVSMGLDIYREDPLSDFSITREGIRQIGLAIARVGLPTALLLEGGYHTATLGDNVAGLLSAFVAE